MRIEVRVKEEMEERGLLSPRPAHLTAGSMTDWKSHLACRSMMMMRMMRMMRVRRRMEDGMRVIIGMRIEEEVKWDGGWNREEEIASFKWYHLTFGSMIVGRTHLDCVSMTSIRSSRLPTRRAGRRIYLGCRLDASRMNRSHRDINLRFDLPLRVSSRHGAR